MSSPPENRRHLIVPGAQKAATTWVQHLLDWNPQTWVPPHEQEVRFFDRHWDRGFDHYVSLYQPAPVGAVTADVTPTYLDHPRVPERITTFLEDHEWDLRFLVILREPVDRFLSALKMKRRQGRDLSLEEAVNDEAMVSKGDYSTHLSRFFDRFDRDRFLVVLLDDLAEDGEGFRERLSDFLGVEDLEDAYDDGRVNPGGDRRSSAIETLLSSGGTLLRALGLTRALHAIKSSRLVQTLYEWNRVDGTLSRDDSQIHDLEERYSSTVDDLAKLLERPELPQRWGYDRE